MTPLLQRARLTGLMVDGVAADDPDPGGMARILTEDQQLDAQQLPETQGQMARLITPSNAPVPVYAANLHFFNRVAGYPDPPILDPNQQPRVIKRVDVSLTNSATSTACCSVVLQRTSWQARLEKLFNAQTADDPARPGDWVDLTFLDPLGDSVQGKLGLLLDIGVVDSLAPGCMLTILDRVHVSNVIANANVPETNGVAHQWCWLCGPAAPTGVPNHAHLNPGVGALGGGIAFASWAPSTEGEAWALGYRDLTS